MTVLDLVAGAKLTVPFAERALAPARPPRILVFDSGLGGLTVFPAVRRAVPDATIAYAADDAGFPYGRWSEQGLVARVLAVMEALVALHEPDVVVVACATASTLVLPPLRARWPSIAFVGTVPAIKPAAAASVSRQISVLATAGTVKREYTRGLVEAYADGCTVTLVGPPRLASLAEAVMRGETVADDAIIEAIAPAFVENDGARTDVVVLACTHYPLLLRQFERLAPWPVTWIDPAPAIARRVETVLAGLGARAAPRAQEGLASAVFTSNNPPEAALDTFLARCGLRWEACPALADLGEADRVA